MNPLKFEEYCNLVKTVVADKDKVSQADIELLSKLAVDFPPSQIAQQIISMSMVIRNKNEELSEGSVYIDELVEKLEVKIEPVESKLKLTSNLIGRGETVVRTQVPKIVIIDPPHNKTPRQLMLELRTQPKILYCILNRPWVFNKDTTMDKFISDMNVSNHVNGNEFLKRFSIEDLRAVKSYYDLLDINTTDQFITMISEVIFLPRVYECLSCDMINYSKLNGVLGKVSNKLIITPNDEEILLDFCETSTPASIFMAFIKSQDIDFLEGLYNENLSNEGHTLTLLTALIDALNVDPVINSFIKDPLINLDKTDIKSITTALNIYFSNNTSSSIELGG